MASDRSVKAMQRQVEAQIEEAVVPLVDLLRGWTAADAAEGCRWAAQTRDLAGLTGQHLLTEVAMYCFDCLDAVLIDGVEMRKDEADGFADALAFAHQTQCRGCDLEDFRPLLNDLETLTNRIVARAKVEAAR
jgi:hypothetical protein